MSRSEDSYRTDLINAINAKLPNPYKAYNSQSIIIDKDDKRIAILKKLKREFDVIIVDTNFTSDKKINTDRIEIAIETKKLGSECIGIDQAEDAFTAFPNLVHTFATNFESKLYHRKRNDPEEIIAIKSSLLKNKYDEIADFVCDCIKKIIESKKEIKKEIDEKEVIDVLYECMEIIQKQMTELSDESKAALNERTLIMWKKSDEKSEDIKHLDYNIKRASSYIVVDQLLFYDLLQRHNTKYTLPPLKPLDPETDIPSLLYTKYMQRAINLTGDYKPIFDIDVLSLLPESPTVINAINEVIDKITRLKLNAGNTDFIGKIFHKMIPSEIRKGLAAYYTGSAPARLLAELAITNPDMKVCDLACGSGTLIVESYHVLKELYKENYPEMTEEKIHKQILENQIYGNDITLFASHLAAMNLASQYLDGDVSRLNITSTDGLQINPEGKPIYTSCGLFKFGLKNMKSPEKIDTIEMKESYSITYPYVDCVIMNPPFSRRMDMSDEFNENLDKITLNWFNNENKRDGYVDKKMGLHGYFIFHADHMLKDGGTIAMVLPTSTFTTDYTSKLLAYLKSKKYAISYVIEILSQRSAFSEDCTFKEYMIICRKGELSELDQTKLISIFDEFSIDDIPIIVKEIEMSTKDENMPHCTCKLVLTSKLYTSSKWTEFFIPKSNLFDSIMDSYKLENYEGNTSNIIINRGYASSYSEYLMLPNKEWDIKKLNENMYQLIHKTLPDGDAQKICNISSKYLVKAIRKSESANSFKTNSDCYVLNIPPELPLDLTEFKRKYVYWAENMIENKWDRDEKKGHLRIPIVKKSTKINKKGKIIYNGIPWYSTPWKSKCSDKRSQLFMMMKYQLSRRRSISSYCESKSVTNDGIHILYSNDNVFNASWTSSAIYLYSLLNHQQIIHQDYAKMQIQDFAQVKFPKYSEFSEEEKRELIAKWEALANLPDDKVPFLAQQLGAKTVKKDKTEIENDPLPERVALDNAWLRVLGVSEDKIEIIRKELYKWLINYMETR